MTRAKNTTDINFGKFHYSSNNQPIVTVNKMSAYYIQTISGVQPHVNRSSVHLLDKGAYPNLTARRYIPSNRLPFIDNMSSTPSKSATKDAILILEQLELHVTIEIFKLDRD